MKKIGILMCLLLLSACAAKAPPRAALPEGRRTQQALQLEKRLTVLRDATPTIKGLAWVEFASGDEERRTEAAVAVERPSRIRIDAMDAIADVWAQAGSDGERLWLFIPSKQKLYEGRATPRTLHKLAKFDWEPSELVAIAAGTPPLGEMPGILQVGEGREGHFVAQGSGIHLWTEGKARVVKCVRYAADGASIDYAIVFSGWRRAGGVEFPHRIEATFPGRGARLLIDYRDVQAGGAFDPSTFRSPASRSRKIETVNGE